MSVAHAEPVVLAVLELAQLGGGGELGVVAVADPSLGEGLLEALGVRPGVLGAAHAAALAYVEQEPHVGPRSAGASLRNSSEARSRRPSMRRSQAA